MTRILMVFLLLCFLACNTAKEKPVEIRNGNVSISYSLSGSGDTTIVLVHGWCIDKSYWKQQQDELKADYTVVALDLGSHGESGRNRDTWTVEEYAKDVIAVIDGLKLKNVILVGHSMGGEIILQTALTSPKNIIGFIGIDNFKDFVSSFSPKDEAELAGFFQGLRTNFDAMAVQFTKASLFPPGSPDTVSINRVINSIQQSDSTVAIRSLESLMQFSLKDSALVNRLYLPFHLIVSDYTPTNETVLKKITRPGSTIRYIRGTGHYPMIEKPVEFTRLLRETIHEIGAKQ